MPTNLNALIRYKTIDQCLSNRSIKCTIERLQNECSEAMGEKRGIYKTISVRTIRDDIRVMRSDILGFNAPIVFVNGRYFYSDKNYSIFQQYIVDVEMLKSVYDLLLQNKDSINSVLVNKAIILLADSLNIEPPREILDKMLYEREPGMNNSKLVKKYLSNYNALNDQIQDDLDSIRFCFAERSPEEQLLVDKIYEKELAAARIAKLDYDNIIQGNINGFQWKSILVLMNHLKN
ncbi:MAG: transcriptional regulator [Bacteroidetes bacterium]|nr:MAG: transcriptional regulator [Bacteroidota bacterium]